MPNKCPRLKKFAKEWRKIIKSGHTGHTGQANGTEQIQSKGFGAFDQNSPSWNDKSCKSG